MLQIAILLTIIVAASFVLVAATVYFVAQWRNQVPPVFTPPRVLGQVVEALDLPEKGRLVDLGCGDGRVMAAVMRAQPRVSVSGMDNNPAVLAAARLRLRGQMRPGGRAELSGGQIEGVKFTGVDRVFAYLGPEMMALLEPRFERELSKGARVVSQQFPLPHRKPVRVVELERGKPYAKVLYIYDY